MELKVLEGSDIIVLLAPTADPSVFDYEIVNSPHKTGTYSIGTKGIIYYDNLNSLRDLTDEEKVNKLH